MTQSVPKTSFQVKLFFQSVIALLLTATVFAQSARETDNNSTPELVFANPVLTTASTTAGKDGAVYKFANVAPGIDATVTILARSASNVVLSTIDEPGMGWGKAFQPTVGIEGDVAPGQTWWMEFQMNFYDAGKTNKKNIKNFKVTALDVDGDGSYIQEFVQMNKATSVANSTVTYLTNDLSLIVSSLIETLTGNDLDGLDKKIMGPKINFNNIDTAATQVMSTFTYDNKDAIKFFVGGKSSGGYSNAGMRMNSLWFKSFSLAPVTVLPVKLSDFSAQLDSKNVLLKWTSAVEKDFSHYTIERSTNGTEYKEIAVVFGNGSTSSSADYHFKDANVASPSGILYYRLRIVDNNGAYTYSNIKTIRLNQEEATVQLTTYPNPVRDAMSLTLPAAWQGKAVRFELYNNSGVRVLASETGSASQNETISIGSLPKGFYQVRAICDGTIATQKIIKQ